MKKPFSDPKILFTLLMIAAVVAIAAGAYLGVALGMHIQASVTVLSAVGILLWTAAWGAFIALCLRLRKGQSAFTDAVKKALTVIGGCLSALAVVICACAVITSMLGRGRTDAFLLFEAVLLPGFFLAAAVAAWILRSLLEHAMAIEKEQEGVV